MTAVPVDPANLDALHDWDGEEGAFWAGHAAAFDAAIAGYTEPLLAAADLAGGSSVVDVGCGNGITTVEAARRSAPGRVLGLDLSTAMLAVAARRAKAAGLANVDLAHADAQVYEFSPGGHDVVMSRFGVMFFADPPSAFANLVSALRPGGRMALVVWQGIEANEWLREFRHALLAGRTPPAADPQAPGPLALGDPDRVRALLTGAGMESIGIEPVSEAMRLGADVDAAAAFVEGFPFVPAMLADLDADGRERALEALRATVAAHAGPDGVSFGAAAWVVTARRPG